MLLRYVRFAKAQRQGYHIVFPFQVQDFLYLKYNIFKARLASDKAKTAINQKITKIELQRDPSVKIYI